MCCCSLPLDRLVSLAPVRGGAVPEAAPGRLLVRIVAVLLLVPSLANAAAERDWIEVESFVRPGEAMRAVALGPGGRVAVATDDRVHWRIEASHPDLDGSAASAASDASAAFDAVRDLAFGPGGRLFVATGAGLFRWAEGERPRRRPLYGDAGSDGIARLVASPAGLVVVAERGAWWSSDGEIFQPLEVGRVGASLSLAGIGRPAADAQGAQSTAVEVWLYGTLGLVRIDGLTTATGLRVLGRKEIVAPRPRSEASPVDLWVEADSERGTTVSVLYPDAIARRRGEEGAWSIERPVLAPGARIRRGVVDRAAGWLATDRGLFVAAAGASWRRVGPAPGAQPCVDVDRRAGSLAMAAFCRSGLHRPQRGPKASSGGSDLASTETGHGGRASDASAGVPTAPAFRLAPDPPVAEIRRRALARAGLEARLDRERWRALSRRGRWPDVEFRLGAGLDRDDRRFADQAFVSGDFRALSDRTRDRGMGFDAVLSLDWELGEWVFPSETVDLSREQRQVLSLRDDVSDEIHQLYFERQRLRARLAAGGPFESGGRDAALLRAAELRAGLDAWTGGWLSSAYPPSPLPPSLSGGASRAPVSTPPRGSRTER